jgi:flagellar biogenesis protein FliO
LNQNGAHTELPFAILNPKLASRMILALGFILVMAWMLAAAPE